MSYRSGFYNALNHDRQYEAKEFSRLFEGIINDGVFDSIGGMMMLSASELDAQHDHPSIVVDTGRAWFNNTWIDVSAKHVVELPKYPSAYYRIDVIAVKVDNQAREDTLVVVPSSTNEETPMVDPSLAEQTLQAMFTNGKLTDDPINGIYWHVLGYAIRTAEEAAAREAEGYVTADRIVNKVGSSMTPFITGVMETANIDALFEGWKKQYTDWLAHLKSIPLDVSTAQAIAHVELEVEAVAARVANPSSIVLPIRPTDWITDEDPQSPTKGISYYEKTGLPITAEWTAATPMILADQSRHDVDEDLLAKEQLGYISRIDTDEGKIALYCYEGAPTMDLIIKIPGCV